MPPMITIVFEAVPQLSALSAPPLPNARDLGIRLGRELIDLQFCLEKNLLPPDARAPLTIEAGGRGRREDETAESREGVFEEAVVGVARDHGVPGDGGLDGGVAEGEDDGGEVTEAGVKVEKLGDEEGVAGTSGDEEEGVEPWRDLRSFACEAGAAGNSCIKDLSLGCVLFVVPVLTKLEVESKVQEKNFRCCGAMTYFPDEVVEHIFDFLSSHRDRNNVSTVCKAWYLVEQLSRLRVFVGNCYAVRPERVMARFPGMKCLTVKGKPHFADFNLVPHDWGGDALPWIETAARCCPGLEELRLKRMVVSDESLELLARAFPNFKSLVLISCEGFSTDGLAEIATHCRQIKTMESRSTDIPFINTILNSSYYGYASYIDPSVKVMDYMGVLALYLILGPNYYHISHVILLSVTRGLRELDLQENEVEDHGRQWLSCFPDSCTSLVSLNFACLKGEVNTSALERLVARCQNLRCLKLNRAISIESLIKILARAPNLVELGTGSFTADHRTEAYQNLLNAFYKCNSIRNLSGFWDAAPRCLQAIYSICSSLTVLNLSYAPAIQVNDLIKMIRHCFKLQKLWVLDSIGDKGLAAVACACKELQELRVFPSDVYGTGIAAVTEEGLVAISSGCPKLNSLLYFCHQMTNAALITVAKNCPHFTRFRLCILDPVKPDPISNEPLDEGFGAIVKSCKDLKRLSLSGLLTDKVFLYIGMYASRLEMLSIAFAGESDKGMVYVLNGCKNLKKLEIRDSPFGDAALLENVGKYETMRSLWMSSCDVTQGGCKALAAKMPRLNVEVINEREESDEMVENPSDMHRVEKMYVYRTLTGPRDDAPDFVWTF
ncbi:hypothetical protein ZIOFF_005604 [Zingiber officinale]|uniref:F-box domain-containing protein n=1 Tax=Zingiber officinale TaxID=94328 RepID=A0A8J5IA86_ZINOF|nr:hypothetical protein ZIOFF_005604 [Zingiber officinale]